MNLSYKQQLQEEDYSGPYHWYKSPFSKKSRLYFGYLQICADFIKTADKKETIILDAGCGDARFLKLLQDHSFEQLYGADYSRRAIEFGKLMLPSAHLTEASIVHLPYVEHFFDAVFLIETLEHIPPDEISPILQELKRVLKPGGQLIITVPSDAEPVAEKHYQHFSAELLRSTIEPEFEIVEILGQDYVPFHFFKIVDKIIDNRLWEIKPLKRWYNSKFWFSHFNRCAAKDGRRLICHAKNPS